jgi:hypothetical protein
VNQKRKKREMNQNQIQKSYKGYLERPQIRIFFARIQNTFLGFEDSSRALTPNMNRDGEKEISFSFS